MLYDDTNELAIIQIPRCGGTSFGEALQATSDTDDDPHCQDSGIMSHYRRVIIVRPPFERFLSCAKWLMDRPELWEEGWEVLNKKGFSKFVKFVAAARELPILFRPQVDWFAPSDTKKALFIPRGKMASWFNHNQAGHLTHRNKSAYHPAIPILKKLEDADKAEISARYYKDFHVLSQLPVWPSTPTRKIVMNTG